MNVSLVFSADPDFADLALAELARATSPDSEPAPLAPGVYRVAGIDFWALAEQWRAAPPIFIRHISPVQRSVELRGNRGDITLLSELIEDEFQDLFEPALSFSVQCRLLAKVDYRPFEIIHALADRVAAGGISLDVRAPQQILSLVIAQEESEIVAYVGLSPAQLNLSSWAGGMRHFARESDQISRSEFKLLEALESLSY